MSEFVFVCDPPLEDVPAVGAGVLAVAQRTTAGVAVRWVPGGDAHALAEFLGLTVTTDGVVLESDGRGGFFPLDLSIPCVWVKPPAGDPIYVPADDFTGRFAVPQPVKKGLTITLDPATYSATTTTAEVTVVQNEPVPAYTGEAVEQVPPAVPAEDGGEGDSSAVPSEIVSAGASTREGEDGRDDGEGTVVSFDVTDASSPVATPADSTEGYPCDQCDKVLKSEAGLKAHVTKVHG